MIPNTQQQEETRKKKNSHWMRIGGVIGILAGIVLFISQYTAHPILITALSYVDQHFSSSMSPDEIYILQLSISVLNYLVSLGGILVIAAGLMILSTHRTSGRILMFFGGGVGMFGLFFTLGEAFYSSNFSLAVFHAEYWIGLVLSALAVTLANRH